MTAFVTIVININYLVHVTILMSVTFQTITKT